MVHTENIEYKDDNILLEGYLAINKKPVAQSLPTILVSHDSSGRNEFACKKAEQLAELGYVGFALDMYGKGKIGKTIDEKTQLMQPLMQDRALLRKRILAALNVVKKLPMVDHNKIAAIGFCFGGLCVLDLARSGADLRGVVSFHGFFHPPEGLPTTKIKASVLAFHGNDDPLVKADQVTAFKNEMTTAKIDWQLHIFGNTLHGFSNPLADNPALGILYNPLAAKRSWLEMQNFLHEIFTK